MKRKELIEIYHNLSSIKEIEGVKLGYAIAKNIDRIKGEVELVQKALNPSEEFQEYENKRIELGKRYAEKDANGKPIVDNGAFIITDIASFSKKFLALKKEHSTAIEEQQKKLAEYEALLDEEVEHELHKVKMEDIPESMAKNMVALYPIIIEE